MRTLKTLIPLLIKELQTEQYAGMCVAIYVLKKYPQTITNEEGYLLQDLVKKSKPTIFMKRYYRRRRFNDCYWTPYEMEPRIEWLNKQLKQLK